MPPAIPLTGPPLPPPIFPPGHPGVQQLPAEDSGRLSALRVRLLESEFGHAFTFTDYSKEAMVANMVPFLKAAKHSKRSYEILGRFAKDKVVPKGTKERAEMLVEVFQEI